MSPEALVLAEKRIELEIRDRVEEFAHAAAQKREEAAATGGGASSRLILAIHALARAEFETRALTALATSLRLLTADESEPSQQSRSEIVALVKQATVSPDIEGIYKKQRDQLRGGEWPNLHELRQRALDLAESELDIELLARRRKSVPIEDALQAPRYEASSVAWKKAKSLAEAPVPDIENAIKEGIAAVESLAKVVVSGSTLGDCLKTLRAQKRIDPGADKILEGLWAFACSSPGVRHGSHLAPGLREQDWRIFSPMIVGAITLLLSVDTSH